MLKRDKKLEKKIARERIVLLMERAFKTDDSDLSRRYVELAMKISSKYRVRIPKEYRNTFCRKCYTPFKSENVKIRLLRGVKTIECLVCGYKKRIPYKLRDIS
ncbi:RNase P subunit RPR2 [Archaeoglobus sulfaticallidus PM70-1]|uniref:Ribonuclease P protein component 4 n=1 Tax=Archaeoglobus sulfaticallidus PM70-1 TaxID=387631 RepID=N0BMB4_9EURY|nr:RNase P subunit RPR2 [Archaeoglobus sulfaticallidus]AGK61766.1 RNase P subunit RPR2 [Archaeoglobus sulfaticallidus PM70-1]